MLMECERAAPALPVRTIGRLRAAIMASPDVVRAAFVKASENFVATSEADRQALPWAMTRRTLFAS